MPRSPRPPDPAGRRPGPLSRLRLWHGMAAVLVAALGFAALRVLGPALLVFPMLVGLVTLVGLAVYGLLVIAIIVVNLPFGLAVLIADRSGRADHRAAPSGPVGPAEGRAGDLK